MKKMKIVALIAAALMVMALFAACSAKEKPAEEAGAKSEGGYDKVLGVIQPGPEDYYQNYSNAVKTAAEYAGMEVTILLSEYSADTEIANVEDLIARGVDAIACFSVASDTAQIDAQLCNEAKVPLFLMSSVAAEGTGVPTCTIGNSFYDMGYQDGQWVAENLKDAQKVLEIQGALGQGIAEEHSKGFIEAIQEAGRDDIEVVFQQTANWVRADAISITEDVISAGTDFNLVFVHNEDMCAGVVSVLEENDMLGDVNVVTMNGSDAGIEMIKEGKVLATCANPPSYVGGDVVVQIMKYFDGKEVPAIFDSPSFIIDSKNCNDSDLVTWDVKWANSRVDEYLG